MNNGKESAEVLTARALLESQSALESIYHTIIRTVALTTTYVDEAKRLLDADKQLLHEDKQKSVQREQQAKN